MVLCGCSSVIHSEGFPDYDRFAQRGYAAEELAKKVGVGFGVNVVCPMIRDLEHGLRKIEGVSIVNKHTRTHTHTHTHTHTGGNSANCHAI